MLSHIYKEIIQLSIRYGAKRTVLFGSRARGDHRENSDIDIAIYGMPKENQGQFWFEADEIETLLKLDIVHITDYMDILFIKNIERDGVILMDKFAEKYLKLIQAVERLQESLLESRETDSLVVRDGVIQRFEFCTELAWKTMREKLIDEGIAEVNSPKATMRAAYTNLMITDEVGWINLISDRNLTSHMYDEETANVIYHNIADKYYHLFTDLINVLK